MYNAFQFCKVLQYLQERMRDGVNSMWKFMQG